MNKTRIIGTLTAAALLTLPIASFAAEGPKGKNEVMGSASYTDIEDTTLTNIDLAYGRYLTDVHEVGLRVGYLDMEFDGVGGDGTTLGGFYHLNLPVDGMVRPYVGVTAAAIGGDLGDAYDFSYGAEAGVKLYAFENAGVNFGVAYQRFEGAEKWIDDADGVSVKIGLLMRF